MITTSQVPQGQRAGKARFEILQIYRAIAALAVVLHHVNGKFSATHYYGDVVPGVFLWGQAGVDFFFVLSGFIITQSLIKSKSAGEFLLHRALRVYPPFWIAFLVTLPVAIFFSNQLHSSVSTDWLALTKAALLLPQPDPPVIGVAWTLHHEVLFYALAGAWIRFPIAVFVTALILLLGSGLSFDHFLAQFLFSPFHWEFVAGVAAFLLARRIPVPWARNVALVSGMGAATACAWFAMNDAFYGGWARFVVLAPLFAVLVAASTRWEVSGETIKSRLWRTWAALGDSSYTLYLWHIPIVTPATKFAFKALPVLNPLIVLFVTVVIAVGAAAVAHAIYRLIEQPVVRALRSRVLTGIESQQQRS